MADTSLVPAFDGQTWATGVGLAFVATYLTAHILEQFRLAMTEDVGLTSPVGLTMSLVFSWGGAAVWVPHLVCAGSVALVNPATGTAVVDKALGAGMVFLSALASVVLMFSGVMVACRDPCFCRSKVEMLTLVKADLDKRHEAAGRGPIRVTAHELFNRAVTCHLHRVVVGGVLNGAGVVVMEYLLLLSWVFPGRVDVTWDTGLVAAAAVAAVVGSVAVYWMIFRLLAVLPSPNESYRLLATLVFTATMCGSSYCSVLSARYVPSRRCNQPHRRISLRTTPLSHSPAFLNSALFHLLWCPGGRTTRTTACLPR